MRVRRTSSLLRSRSLSSSTPRYENVRNVRFFLSSAARAGSVISESYIRQTHRQHFALSLVLRADSTTTHHFALSGEGRAGGRR